MICDHKQNLKDTTENVILTSEHHLLHTMLILKVGEAFLRNF